MIRDRIAQWDDRYRSGEQVFRTPAPLVVEFTQDLKPGAALDLASGPGRNSVYLAERGWQVTAVDGSSVAIDLLSKRGLTIDARVADLEAGEFVPATQAFDLVLSCYYFQRDLIPAMKQSLRPGGLVILIAHLLDDTAGDDESKAARPRAYPNELPRLFDGWRILHYREGDPDESCHRRPVAELVAQLA